MKTLAYIRQSTKKETGKQMFSTEIQTEVIKNYAKNHNLKIDEFIVEEQSAWKTGRPKFNEMLETATNLAQKTPVKILIAKHDRATRNFDDQMIIEAAMNRGVIFEAIDIGIYQNNAMGKFQSRINTVVSSMYSDLISERVREQHNISLKQKLYPSGVKIGYLPRQFPKQPHQSDPNTAPIIREIFERILDRQPTQNIYLWLQKIKLRTRTGKIIGKNAFYKLIRDPFYHGDFMWKGQLYRGNHEQIISRLTFNKAQKILDNNSYLKIIEHYYLFQKIAVCADCGHPLGVSTNKKHRYYRCRKCKSKLYRETDFEKFFVEFLKKAQIKPEQKEIVKEALKKQLDQFYRDSKMEKREITMQISEAKNRLKNLEEKWLDEKIDDQKYYKITKKYETEVEENQKKIFRNRRNPKIQKSRFTRNFELVCQTRK